MTNEDVKVDEVVLSFVAECREMVDEVEPVLIELGAAGDMDDVDMEKTNLIFRMFHSMKGTASFLQFNEIVRVTHEAETLLDIFRRRQMPFRAQDTDLLCKTCDTVNALLSQIEETGKDIGNEAIIDEIIESLRRSIHAWSDPDNAKSTINEASEKIPAKREETTDISTEANTPPVPENLTFELTPDMIERFVAESIEMLEKVEEALLALEKDPTNYEYIQESFRELHSFKGNCGFFGYRNAEQVSHKTETLLEALKDGYLAPDENIIRMLLLIVDTLNQCVIDISKGGSGDINNVNVFLDLLDDAFPPEDDTFPPEEESGRIVEQPVVEQQEALWLLREKNDSKPPSAEPQADKNISNVPAVEPLKSRSISRQDIRVNLPKLDKLINLVGELVIAEAMVSRNPDLRGYEFENFEKSANHLGKIIREIQDMTLSIRMIPVSGVFRKMIRLVHDLSARAGKKVELKLLGEDTEIDKTVSELIADPLVHLIRNAIDHGLETPEGRKSAGKNSIGEIVLEAKHEGGEIWIAIKDDGKGLDRNKILKKGIEQGLVKGDGSEMSDQEVFELIFQPGFSTADKITDISGRGVGMDVVKKNVEKIKGAIDIRSKKGEGSLVVMRIPLTLAIIEGMLVRVGHTRYTIPLLSIRESIQVEEKKITTTMDGQELVKIRDDLIPVIRLHELHNIKPDVDKIEEGLLVVCENRSEKVCLLIDEIIGEQQAVIKGLSNYIGNIQGVSGCTILGDGEISLILDIGGLIQKACIEDAA